MHAAGVWSRVGHPTTLLLLLLGALLACDGDGCYGGPDGPATRFCQQALGTIDAGPAQLATACKQCCVQEVPYEGTIEDGKCVCER